jgi:hypothetical protein
MLSRFFFTLLLIVVVPRASAAEPLHREIDRLIQAKGEGLKFSPLASDAEFLRRLMLDLVGRIPTIEETRSFLAESDPKKRAKRIALLLESPQYAKRMTELVHLMYLERLGDHAEWASYLQKCFETNRPWNQMAREILRADPKDSENKGAAFFYAKRLENYGQNPVDYPALTRDVGRLFLGKDLRCAECHDHLFIKSYKQKDFQGLFAFYRNTALGDAKVPSVTEKPTLDKVNFMSVFFKKPREIGPAIPGGKEFEVPPLKKGEEYVTKPDPKTKSPGELKFSPLALLSEELPKSEQFARTSVNRFWFLFIGRGIVHPLDLDHDENPPSHPELLDLLTGDFIANGYNLKRLIQEILLSETYQRSSHLPEGVKEVKPERFQTAIERRVSAEQLLQSLLTATGGKPENPEVLKAKFLKAFANPPREPEEEYLASLKAALFLLNDPAVLNLLQNKPGSLIERLLKKSDAELTEELYLSVFSRQPTNGEKQQVEAYLKERAASREKAVVQLTWAMLASTEFATNH